MILSITGADNLTSIEQLVDLKNDNPHVEWGLLYFLEKQGTPRNPDYEWRKNFMNIAGKDNISLHLCGETVFRTILSDDFENSNIANEFKNASRIQININARKDIFTHDEIHAIYLKLLQLNFRIILQYNNNSKSWIIPFLEKYPEYHKNIDILLDSSLGKGIVLSDFSIPEELNVYSFKYGFAGGISPDNIQEIHNKVKELGVDYWLDLESGARTDNAFDLQKATTLATLVKLTDLISISDTFSNLFGHHIKTPNYALVVCRDKSNFSHHLTYSFDEDTLWGSDCRGGFAYFGKTEDMKNILQQSTQYLKNIDNNKQEYLQGIFFWNLGEYSLLNLYEDYYQNEDNPLPEFDNTLRVKFGAWSGNANLLEVLQSLDDEDEEDEDEDEQTWITFRGNPVNIDDVFQQNLLKNIMLSIHEIDKNLEKI